MKTELMYAKHTGPSKGYKHLLTTAINPAASHPSCISLKVCRNTFHSNPQILKDSQKRKFLECFIPTAISCSSSTLLSAGFLFFLTWPSNVRLHLISPSRKHPSPRMFLSTLNWPGGAVKRSFSNPPGLGEERFSRNALSPAENDSCQIRSGIEVSLTFQTALSYVLLLSHSREPASESDR